MRSSKSFRILRRHHFVSVSGQESWNFVAVRGGVQSTCQVPFLQKPWFVMHSLLRTSQLSTILLISILSPYPPTDITFSPYSDVFSTHWPSTNDHPKSAHINRPACRFPSKMSDPPDISSNSSEDMAECSRNEAYDFNRYALIVYVGTPIAIAGVLCNWILFVSEESGSPGNSCIVSEAVHKIEIH